MSEAFNSFAQEWNFRVVHSSPRFPQSNGLSEKTVSIVKRIFKKARDSKKDPYLAILAYRTTHLKSCELSPSELCMSRRLRSNLPCTNDRLKPQPLKLNDVRKKFLANRERQKKFHDRSAKHLSSLQKGDKVRVQIFDKLWKPAVITDQHSNHSYILQTHDGNVYRRNRKFIHKSKGQTFEDSDLMPLLKYQEKIVNCQECR